MPIRQIPKSITTLRADSAYRGVPSLFQGVFVSGKSEINKGMGTVRTINKFGTTQLENLFRLTEVITTSWMDGVKDFFGSIIQSSRQLTRVKPQKQIMSEDSQTDPVTEVAPEIAQTKSPIQGLVLREAVSYKPATSSEGSIEVFNDNAYVTIIANQTAFLKKFIIIIVVLFVAQFGLIGTFLIRSDGSNSSAQNSIEQSTSTLVGLVGEGQPGVRILQDFRVNQGIVDVGFNVDVTNGTIGTRQHSNCKTPVPPPEENGCGFTLIPSALGLPLNGVNYKRLSFDMEYEGTARIKVDIMDYERGVMTKDLSTWNSSEPKPFVLLPTRLRNSEGIRLRFWTDTGDITVNQIKIEFDTAENLKPVALKLNDKIASLLTPESIGLVYQDRNQDRFLTAGVDEPWTCKADFAGVEPIKFDEQNAGVLLRDEQCYTLTKPDDWYTDKRVKALPAGDWLLVFPNESLAAPFSVSAEADTTTLELSETSPL